MTTLALPAPMQSTAGPSKSPKTNLALPLPLPPPSTQPRTLALPGMPKTPSPEPADNDDEDGENDDEDEEAGRKKKKKKPAAAGGGATGLGGNAGTNGMGVDGKAEYKYSSEISQMMFVFGEVQDPLPETVRLVEDVVRGQIIEIVTRARLLTHLRSSRFLSAEDLIFLIRDDRGKVNRLRTYLSWKDVRKRAKEDEEGGGDVDVEEADKAAPKGRKTMVKLPWELLTPFSDFLKVIPSAQRAGLGDDEDDEDEDEMQAYQDSMQRLKDADEITKKMTKDEYVHYSDCRQASFTYRKARRFREFVNFSAYLDTRPNDDIIDILGFLSFEMVRSLCVTALEVRDRLEKMAQQPPLVARKSTLKPSTTGGDKVSPMKRKGSILDSPTKKLKGEIVASPEPATPAKEDAGTQGAHRKHHQGMSLFAPPPSARQALLPAHVLEAFAQIQREQAANRTGSMRNWRGGSMTKGAVALV